MDVIDVLGDLLVDLEKAAASSPSPRLKEENKMQKNSMKSSNYVITNNAVNCNAVNCNASKNYLAPPGAVEPSFLYAPDKDILTGLPLIRTPSPGPLSPRIHNHGGSRPGSAMSNIANEEVPQYSINDSNDDFKFQSYHLDYKYTPPPIKGPCCVCGDGIMGAMVTALDKMWHPEHFCCAHCGIELRFGLTMYSEHEGKPYCKICHGKLFLPPCSGCKKNITGTYIKAMGKIWHEPCFQCVRCRKVLTPTTYFEKDGDPYCEDDYHDLFSPKCHLCRKPIKDERAKLTVHNKNYHAHCFKCCECGVQLTPQNFKEKDGRLYCEKDFNDLFMPKCGGCHTPILSNPVTALGKKYHPQCFKCTECKRQLNPDRFFEKNGLPYCEDDFHKLFSPKCNGCKQPIKDQNKMINAMAKPWHPHCFNCTECGKNLTPNTFFEKNGLPYCEDDFHKLFSQKCSACKQPIKDPNKMINAMSKPWHSHCFNCTECGKNLTPNNYFEKNNLPYCEDDYHKLFSPKCAGCSKQITDPSKMVTAMGKPWHKEHFNCTECGKILSPENYFEKNGLPYCEDDFHRLFSPKCAGIGCGQPIKDQRKMVVVNNKPYHPEHFSCSQCGKQLAPNNFFERDGLLYCEDDFHRLFSPRCNGCGQPVKDQLRMITALGKPYHDTCLNCDQCGRNLKENEFFELDGRILCLDDYLDLVAPKCIACKKPIKEEYCLVALDGDWHPNCFRCKDCGCLLEERNFYEIDGDPFCEEHFHARQCPDCIKMRRAQNKYFGLPSSTPMGPTRWASQVSLKSLTEVDITTNNGGGGLGVGGMNSLANGNDGRPVSNLSQYSTTSYDTAYTDGGGRSSPSMRSYLIPIEREGGGIYRNSDIPNGNGHVHGEGCHHDHDHVHMHEKYQSQSQMSQRSSLKRGQSQSHSQGDLHAGRSGGLNSPANLQYIARNENPYNYLDPGKFPVESKHIRFSDTVTKREFETEGKYY